MKRFFVGIFCLGLLLGNVQAKLVGHWPMKPTVPMKIIWDADDADESTWRVSSAATSGPANIPIVDNDGDKVWELSGYKAIYSSSLVPIDPSKSYRLTGTFRSTGSVNSKVYFGFIPILDDGTNSNQTPANAFRKGDNGIIQSWNDTSITLSNSPTGWNPGTVSMGSRTIGFYYDGNTSHFPDFIFYSSAYGTDRGAYTDITGSQITLSSPIPASVQANIQPGVTVVKNHYHGCSSYLYSVLSGNILPQTWNTYSDISTGDGWTQTQCEAFRPFTRFVRIMFLPNYSQTTDSTLQFDNIILEEVQGNEDSIDGSFKIYDNAPFHTIAIDSHHHGSNYGGTYTEGPNGASRGAMSFDGTNDYIDLGNIDILGGSTEATWTAWVKPIGAGESTWQSIITTWNDSTNTWVFDLRYQGLAVHIKTLQSSGASAYYCYEGQNGCSNFIPYNEWTHVVATFNNGTLSLYANGILQKSFSTPGTSIAYKGLNEKLLIGGDRNGNIANFNGAISDVRIYDHALSQAEITALSIKKENFTSTATITTKNTNKTAIPKLLYWDLTSKEYWQGQTDGSLQRVSAPTSSFKNTTELTTIQTGKNATTGQLYWDTDKKKYYIGQPDGDLRPLSE